MWIWLTVELIILSPKLGTSAHLALQLKIQNLELKIKAPLWVRQALVWQLRIERPLGSKIVRVAHCRSLITFAADRASPCRSARRACSYLKPVILVPISVD